MRYLEPYQSVKVNSWKKRDHQGNSKSDKNKRLAFFSPVIEIDINFTEIKCFYYLVSVKTIITKTISNATLITLKKLG